MIAFGSAMAPDRLSYHDVFLHPEDIALLKGSHWINDQVKIKHVFIRSMQFYCKANAPSNVDELLLFSSKFYSAPTRSFPQIISFWFEYLNKEKYPYLSDSVALIGGATAFLLCQLGARLM